MLRYGARHAWRRGPSFFRPLHTVAHYSRGRLAHPASSMLAAAHHASATHPVTQTCLERIGAPVARCFSTEASPNENVQSAKQDNLLNDRKKRRFADDIKEYKERAATGTTATFDKGLVSANMANVFPRIKTTSLSTKRIVIHDKARKYPVTLVLVAFRSFADEQLQRWKAAFVADLSPDAAQWFDVTINESFGSQALSGFIQRLQRSRTDPALHDYYVAFNSKAREPLEALLPSSNRMFGYALLLDRHARVRFRASGMPSQEALEKFISCTRQLLKEDTGPF